jgi:hypothetical protein
MRIHATSRIGETGLNILDGFLIFFNGFPIFLNGFPKSSTAFRFPRNPRKSIYGKKCTKDHYLSFAFFAIRSPTCAPSFIILTTIPNSKTTAIIAVMRGKPKDCYHHNHTVTSTTNKN